VCVRVCGVCVGVCVVCGVCVCGCVCVCSLLSETLSWKIIVSYMEIGIMNVVLCLGGSVNFCSHVCLIWVKLEIRELHIMLLSRWEFSENWCRAGYAYIMIINKIILCRYCETL